MRLATIVLILITSSYIYGDDPALVAGRITVFGSRIEVSPAQLETPAGVPIFLNTTGKGLSGKIRGELRGPGIIGALSFQTDPGSPFQLPALQTKGSYFFEDIRLENNGQILASATPDRVEIKVIDVLISQITSRPLSLEEIRSLGIVINESDFTAVSFEVGLQFNSTRVPIVFPLLIPKQPSLQPIIPVPPQGVRFASQQLQGTPSSFPGVIPNFVPVTFAPTIPDFDGVLPDIPGLLVFPNDIAFLNQFFAVVLMVSNGASTGSNLEVDDLTAQIVFDPTDVKLVKTNPPVPLGTSVPVRLPGFDGQIGTADDINLILATQTGKSEFFVEGLQEGTHTIRMNLHGTLKGLVQGDVPITGSATGAVLVRNPNFSVTFSHPSIVRAFEPYDLFVTVTNTSAVDANLVRLTIPTNELVNCVLLGDPFQDFETIRSGESGTVKFRINPQVTGQVTTAVIASTSNVKGQFQLRVSVGEKGIPLSPNTLLLPEFVNQLGPDLLQKGLGVLGLAFSAATAPPGGMPPGVPHVSKSIVTQRATEFARAAQHFQLGESKSAVLSHLLLDWMGNTTQDAGFTDLLRTTEAGSAFLEELFGQLNLGATNILSFHDSLAQNLFFRNRYLSAVVTSATSAAGVSLTDTNGNFTGERFTTTDGLAQWVLTSTVSDPLSHALRLNGSGGTSDLSVIAPVGSAFYQAEIHNLPTAIGKSYEIIFDQALSPTELHLKDEQGATIAIPMVAVQPLTPAVISAVQDAKADKTGHLVAVLFNQPVIRTSGEKITNYSVAGNRLFSAQLQSDSRIVYLAFQNPISPLMDNDLFVSGVQPVHGSGLIQGTTRIQTNVTTEAGRVTGRFISSDGTPIPAAQVQLSEIDDDDLFGEPASHMTAATVTNAQGEFTFEYARKLPRPFTITAQEPLTGEVGQSSSSITYANQLIRLDIVLIGRGTIKGRVFQKTGLTTVPVPSAVVTAIAANEQVHRQVLTDANGNYLIDRVAVGSVNLSAQNVDPNAASKFFGATSSAIPLAGSVVSADIEVTTTHPGAIKGRVLQSNGTDPISGAYVLLSLGATIAFIDTSDAQGWFQFDQVPPGAVTLKAMDSSSGRTIGAVNLTLAAGATATVNIVSSGSGTIEAVVSLATAMNLSDVIVAVQGTQFAQRLSSSNTVLFTEIPVGNWEVLANNTKTGDVVRVTARILYSGSTAIVSLRFPEKGTISGEIKTVDGPPAANSTVLLFGGTFAEQLMAVATADENGRYLFKDLAFGKYVVHAISANQTDGGSGTLTEISASNRNPASNVTFIGKGTITVHVETSAGPVMTPVKLSTVTFDYDGTISRVITYTRTTDPSTGNAVFTDVFRKPFTAEASTPLTLPARVGGTLAGPSATVNILLTENPNISGIVHDADGNAVQAQVTYKGVSGTQTLTTATDGTFTFNRIGLGLATFTAFTGSTKGELERMIVAVNDPIDIHLIGFGSVHGMVKDADGNPVGGANLKLLVPGLLARTLQGVSTPDGTYHFDSVPAVGITLEAYDTVRGGRAGVTIIHKADVPLDVILGATGTVQGTVFQSDGVTRVVAAEVMLNRGFENVGTATTDGNGNYLFQHVPISRDSQDRYQLEVFSKSLGRRATAPKFLMTANHEIFNQNLILEGIGSVEGFVFDYTGSQAIPGALLNLNSHGVATTQLNSASGNDGDFQFHGVPQGPYTLTARKDLLVGQASGSITRDGEAKAQNLLMQPGAGIRGVIQFFDGTQILSGVNPIVRISSSVVGSLQVDAPDGNFVVTALPYGAYTLTTNFTHANRPYRGVVKLILDSPGETSTVLRLKGLNTLNVAVTGFIPGAANSIKLTYSNDMENRTESAGIPSDGIVQFFNVPEAKYTLMAKSGDLLTASASGTFVGDGETVNITLPLTASGTVQGTVYRNGLAAPGVSITLKGTNYTLFAYTDDAGQFNIPGVPLGAYTLAAEDLLQSDKARENDSIDFENDLNTHSLQLDGLVPSVLSTSPAAGATGVPNDSTIRVVFSEPMDVTSTQAAFSLTSIAGNVAGAVRISGAELTFVPITALQPQRTYNIVVARSAQDVAGNTIPADFVASFTSIDTVPPGINITLPVNLAFNVPLNTTLQVYFNETIANRGIYTVIRSSGQPATVANELWNAARTVLTLQFALPFVQNERVTFHISGYSDPVGNVQTVPTTIVFDTIDNQAPLPPSLSSTDADNKIREGTSVTILAAIAETLINIDFYINGALQFRDTSPPYQFVVPSSLTTIAANGSNQLVVKATATDRSGNTSPETTLALELLPDAPPQVSLTTTPPPGNVVSGGVIRANYTATDDGSITKVLILVTGAINQTLDVGSAATGSKDVTLPGNLSAGSSIYIRARATEESGKSTTSASADFTIVTDSQSPNVSLLLPDASTIYQTSQTVLARASATDNARVSSVEFYGTYTDEQNQPVTLILGTDTTPSGTNFDVSFEFPRTDTLVIFARAIDPSGNTRDSGPRTLHASFNEFPAVTFTEPSNGAQVIQKTTITLRATASDSDGSVASVKFYAVRNGTETFIAQDNSGPVFSVNYVVPQDSAAFSLTFKALATDNVGDTSSTSVSVTAITDPKATVTGRVIDINRVAVSGATAQLFLNSLSVAMAATDSSGTYTFTQASTIDGNYVVRVSHTLGIAETLQVKPVSPVTNMPEVVLRSGIDSKTLPGLTSQVVTAVHWYDAAAERTDHKISFDEAWRFGVLQTSGPIGNAKHIHLHGYPISPFNALSWTLEIIDQNGSPAAEIKHGTNTTTMPLSAQPSPIAFGANNTGLTISFDPNVTWRTGDEYSFASWYLESPSGTRGGTQHFPDQAILIATNNEIHIYDASNDSLWMRFVIGAATLFQVRIHAMDAMYGKIYAGGNTTAGCLNAALNVVAFKTDSGHRYKSNPVCSGFIGGNFNGTIFSRNAGVNFTTSPNYPDYVNSITSSLADLDVTRIGDQIWIAAIGGAGGTIKEGTGAKWFLGPGGSAISWDEQGQVWYHTQTSLARATNTLSQITTLHTDPAGQFPRDLFVDRNFVYVGTSQRGVDLYNRTTGVYSAGVFSAPAKLAGNSNDVSELTAHASRLWAVSQFNTGGLSVLDPLNGQFLASIPVPQIPSTHLSSIDHGSTVNVPLSLVVGSHASGAKHIKGDYQSIGLTSGLVVSDGKQSPRARVVQAGEESSVLQLELNNGSDQALVVNSITLKASGTGNDSADIHVSLYQDSDGNGFLSAPDVMLGAGAFDNDNGVANIYTTLSLASSNHVSLLVVYEWNTNGEPGRTYAAGVVAIDASFSGGQPVSIFGLNQPPAGSTFTLKTADAVDLLNTQDPSFPNEEIVAMFFYDVLQDPSAASADANWKNGIIKVTGNPAVNPASNIVVTGTQVNAQRIEIRINADETFAYRTISSDVAGLPSFTGNIPIASAPQAVGATGMSLSFIGTQFTPGDVFRIATWSTEPVAGIARGAFPDRAFVIATRRTIRIVNADTLKTWMDFQRPSPCSSNTLIYVCTGTTTNPQPLNDIAMMGGRLYFTMNEVSSVDRNAGLHVIDFVRDEAFRLNTHFGSRYFGSATANTPRANLRERHSGFTYGNQVLTALSVGSVQEVSLYFHQPTSTTFTAVRAGGAVSVVRWGSTIAITSISGVSNTVDLDFSSTGSLYIANSTGTIFRSSNYTSVAQSRTISGIVSTKINVDGSSIYIGHTNGVRVIELATLADKASYLLQGSQQVSALDSKQGHLFVGTATEVSGALNIFNTSVDRSVMVYTRDQGLPSNDITAVAASNDSENFIAAIGTKNSGVAFLKGTLEEVTAFSGLSVDRKELFASEVTPPQQNFPLLWFDLINKRPIPAELSSIQISTEFTGDPLGITAHLVVDADRSGTVTAGDMVWGSLALSPSLMFQAPAELQIPSQQRIALLFALDLPPGTAGQIQASIPDDQSVVAFHDDARAILSGTPITGNSISSTPRLLISSPASNSSFTEGSTINVVATANHEVDEVTSIEVQVTGVPTDQIQLAYSPVTPSLTRTVTAACSLPAIAANGGSNQITITVSSNDGGVVNSVSIPITLVAHQ